MKSAFCCISPAASSTVILSSKKFLIVAEINEYMSKSCISRHKHGPQPVIISIRFNIFKLKTGIRIYFLGNINNIVYNSHENWHRNIPKDIGIIVYVW